MGLELGAASNPLNKFNILSRQTIRDPWSFNLQMRLRVLFTSLQRQLKGFHRVRSVLEPHLIVMLRCAVRAGSRDINFYDFILIIILDPRSEDGVLFELLVIDVIVVVFPLLVFLYVGLGVQVEFVIVVGVTLRPLSILVQDVLIQRSEEVYYLCRVGLWLLAIGFAKTYLAGCRCGEVAS